MEINQYSFRVDFFLDGDEFRLHMCGFLEREKYERSNWFIDYYRVSLLNGMFVSICLGKLPIILSSDLIFNRAHKIIEDSIYVLLVPCVRYIVQHF